MRRRNTLILLLSFFCIAQIQAQTKGTLAVSVTTSSTGGTFAPKNILAIWIEDSSGKFVKTLLAYADKRKQYLTTWATSTTSSGTVNNSVDAITGATQSSHGTRTCNWNGTDYAGNLMPDGDYKVRMELTDKNATGNSASFTFSKGATAQKLSPASVSSFSAVTLNWSTTVTAINPELTRSNAIVVYPNPGNGIFNVLGENIISLSVTSLSEKVVCISQTPVFDISGQPDGIYFVSVKTDLTTVVKKIIKNYIFLLPLLLVPC